jgi:membrane fusion protein, heavy metal efflux system
MSTRKLKPVWIGRRAAVLSLLTVAATWLYAHEGHVALPSRGAQVDAAKGTIILSRESRGALDVRSAEVLTQPLPESVLAYATLIAPWQRHAFASSRLSGRIIKLNVEPGQTVEARQVLAEVASVELENLQLEILSAQAELQLAEKTVASLRESGGAVAEQVIFDAENKRQQARNALEIGRAKWRGLGLLDADLDSLLRDPNRRVTSYPVRSPLAGAIIHADLNVGKVVDPGEHLFEIVDLSRVWAKIGVLEKDLRRVTAGQDVELRFSGQSGEAFRTTIQTVGVALDPQTHLNAVWAELENATGREPEFLPGMTGLARILIPVAGGTRVIPAAALIDDGLAQYVLVEEAKAEKQSEYRRKNVVVVRQTADYAEVRSAELFPGDRVVTQGAHELGRFFVPGVLKLSPEAAKTIGLEVAPVGHHVIDDVIELDGQVDFAADRRSGASAQLAGNIQRILVDRGQSVKAGQVLAEVYSLELKKLQLDLIREQLTFDLLDAHFQTLQKVAGTTPKRKLLDLEAELNTTRFRRDSLRNRLSMVGLAAAEIDSIVSNRKLLDVIPVRSPLDGFVTGFEKVLGQSVKAEEPLFLVTDLSRPLIQGFVPERDMRGIRAGQTARVRLVTESEMELTGRVVRSGQIFTSEDQTVSVWIELDGPLPGLLRLGQLARITLSVEQHAATAAIPHSAVIREGNRAYVFVRKRDGAFDRRAVVIGRADDRNIEVTSGLAAGEVIAIRGASGLQTAYSSIR